MSDEVTYDFIRGDTFEIPISVTEPNNNDVAVDISGWTIESQIRYSKRLIQELTVTVVNAQQGQFKISATKEETANWLPRKLKCDIQFDRPEGRVSSQTFIINVSEDQTI